MRTIALNQTHGRNANHMDRRVVAVDGAHGTLQMSMRSRLSRSVLRRPADAYSGLPSSQYERGAIACAKPDIGTGFRGWLDCVRAPLELRQS